MTPVFRDLFIAGAAFAAGAINAGAGGGSFVSFPALLATGVAPVSANATNSLAVWLGSLASIGPFRSQMRVPRATLTKMLVTSTAGSIAGALLLLRTSNAAFSRLLPFLLLGSTLIFIAGPRLARASQRSKLALTTESPLGLCAQFAIAVYGGFFGAAIGILMLALLGILGMADPRRANAFKVLLASVINGVAVVPFVLARVIAWEPAVVMSAGAVAGGILGAGLVKRLPSAVVRAGVIAVACAMTAYYFWLAFARR